MCVIAAQGNLFHLLGLCGCGPIRRKHPHNASSGTGGVGVDDALCRRGVCRRSATHGHPLEIGDEYIRVPRAVVFYLVEETVGYQQVVVAVVAFALGFLQRVVGTADPRIGLVGLCQLFQLFLLWGRCGLPYNAADGGNLFRLVPQAVVQR